MDKCTKLVEYLVNWYPDHARDLPWRKDTEPYHVWISEIMLQQTRVEAVKEYYKRFLKALPTIDALASVEDDYLLKLWEGLGYYNRARNLKKAAVAIVGDRNGAFPDTYEEILSLAGIGEYTAGAIGSICFDLPTPAVDGNVLRVYTRVMEEASNIDKQATKKKIREQLAKLYSKGQCGILTQSLMELGATVCLANGTPKCGECPLRTLCGAKEHDTWRQYPVRDGKKSRKREDKTVFVLRCRDRIAVRKRAGKGLLAGMWEFPNVEGILIEQQAADAASQWNTAPERMHRKLTYTHVFSHVEWRMTAYYLVCGQMCERFRWVTMEELEHEVAMPSAFRPFLDTLSHNAE
ncbi:MAG: A/G-specific adenine glycosylase [Lachnospiraceae bacterium]|nr:A/G-specific adenine glycosylase [Lachnospiraceae bacterium]